MLTLPSEITNNKNLVAIKPILLVEFASGLNYWIASQEYDLVIDSGTGMMSDGTGIIGDTDGMWQMNGYEAGHHRIRVNGTDCAIVSVIDDEFLETNPVIPYNAGTLTWALYAPYEDLIKHGIGQILDTSINEGVNSLGSVAQVTLSLTGWQSNLRADLIGSAPDLTESEVNLYLKLNTTNCDFANAVKFYSGRVADYNIKRDIMSLKLKSQADAFGNIPENKVIFTYPAFAGGGNLCLPYQYGDFNWDINHLYWSGHTGNYAQMICIGKNSDGNLLFYIADHAMNQMRTTSTDYADANCYDAYMFVYANGMFFRLKPTIVSYQNSAAGAWITVSAFAVSGDYTFLHFTDDYTANTMTDWANACDGNAATQVGPIIYDDALKIQTLVDYNGNANWESGFGLNSSSTDSVYVGFVCSFGSVGIDGDATSFQLQLEKSSGSLITSMTVTGVDSSTVKKNSVDAKISISELKNCHLDTFLNYSSDPGTSNMYVKEVLVIARPVEVIDWFQYFLDNPTSAFLRCEGKEYSGTWGARKTSGNLIENPVDILESILRDRYSITSIDTANFDDAYDFFNGASIKACFSLIQSQDGVSFLKQYCEAFNLSLVKNILGNWRVLFPKASIYNFSSSGTGTPGNEDIFTDTDSLSLSVYAQHPILNSSFELSRTDPNSTYVSLIIEYKSIDDSLTASTSTDSGGAGKLITLENPYISQLVSAVAFRGYLATWHFNQKWVANFSTFYNAIAHEIGDIINIRHDDLNDAMLPWGSVNTQKWMIIRDSYKWHPNIIEIIAIELP